MAKKLTVEITPAQARAIIWAVNTLETSYEGVGGEWERDSNRAVRTLAGLYEAAAEYADKN
jgi:hypothetical protein